MIGRWHLGVLGAAIAIVGSGCNDPSSPWYYAGNQAEKKPGATATPDETDATADEPRVADDVDQPADPTVVEARVQEFLGRLDSLPPEEEAASMPIPADAGGTAARAEPTDGMASEKAKMPPSTAGSLAANVPIALGSDPDDATPSPEPPRATPEKPRVEALTIQTAAHNEGPPSEQSDSVNANAPLAMELVEEQESLVDTIDRLEVHVAETPDDWDAQWALGLLQLASGREEEAAQIADGSSQEPSGLIADTICLVAGVRRAVLEPGRATDEALARLDALRDELARDAELLIPKTALCTRVNTFGVYDEMPAEQFLPYQVNRTIVYCEIKNFHSEVTSEGRYRVKIASHLELLTADGHCLWEHSEPDIEDLSRQRRQDFFLAQLVSLPATVGPGDYVLKVTIEDTLAAKACQAVCPLRIEPPAFSSATP